MASASQKKVPTSASVAAVRVMLSWALGNALPMMQCGARQTAHALGVVGETGGAGGVADCGGKAGGGQRVRCPEM